MHAGPCRTYFFPPHGIPFRTPPPRHSSAGSLLFPSQWEFFWVSIFFSASQLRSRDSCPALPHSTHRPAPTPPCLVGISSRKSSTTPQSVVGSARTVHAPPRIALAAPEQRRQYLSPECRRHFRRRVCNGPCLQRRPEEGMQPPPPGCAGRGTGGHATIAPRPSGNSSSGCPRPPGGSGGYRPAAVVVGAGFKKRFIFFLSACPLIL